MKVHLLQRLNELMEEAEAERMKEESRRKVEEDERLQREEEERRRLEAEDAERKRKEVCFLASHWSQAKYILSVWPPIGHRRGIFSVAGLPVLER
jgi:hypothetical protein